MPARREGRIARKRLGQFPRGRSVQPIRSLKDVQRIRENLGQKPRDLLLFDLATETGMRMKDLLELKVRDLRGLKVMDKLPLADRTGRTSRIPVMNETVQRTFQRYFREIKPKDDDYLIRSRKGKEPLSVSGASRMIRGLFRDANLKGLTGSRTLRKTYLLQHEAGSKAEAGLLEDQRSLQFLKPVESMSLQERVYQELVRAILSGRIPPGERLVTERIAEQVQVSHMPVREALHRLEARGFVLAQKKRGYIVEELSRENLTEVTKIRMALETMAVEAACLRRADETLKRLESLHQQYERAVMVDDVDEYFKLNRAFHHTIYREAGMPILQRMIDGLRDRISPCFHILCRDLGEFDSAATLRNHRGMLDGMERQDPEEIIQWIGREIDGAARVLTEMFVRIQRQVGSRSEHTR